MSVEDDLDLKTVCDAIGTMEHKWPRFGVQLGIPRYVLKKFEDEKDPLSAVVDYWLRGNVKFAVLSWSSIVKALESTHVDEEGLARSIRDQYCCVKEDFEEQGKPEDQHCDVKTEFKSGKLCVLFVSFTLHNVFQIVLNIMQCICESSRSLLYILIAAALFQNLMSSRLLLLKFWN